MKTKKSIKTNKEYHLDASHKPLGRFATEVAALVRGKNAPDFLPSKLPHIRVIISNIKQIGISEKKLNIGARRWVTQYPGGLKTRTWRESFSKNPETFFVETVRRMLPNNKLRNELLKMITFE